MLRNVTTGVMDQPMSWIRRRIESLVFSALMAFLCCFGLLAVVALLAIGLKIDINRIATDLGEVSNRVNLIQTLGMTLVTHSPNLTETAGATSRPPAAIQQPINDPAKAGCKIKPGSECSNANLSHTNLTNANLRNTNLSNAALHQVTLNDADLRGVNLSGAFLQRAELRHATLIAANLSRANLSDADLSGADLSNADLSGAILLRVTLSDTVLSGVIYCKTTMPDGKQRTDPGRSC